LTHLISKYRDLFKLKSGSGVTQGRWNWYRSTDWLWFTISVL